MHFSVGRLQQNVGKNRQRSARADDVLDLLQTFEELFFSGAKLHENNSDQDVRRGDLFGNRKVLWAKIGGYTQRCRALSIKEIVCRMLSCSCIRLFTNLQTGSPGS